MFSNMKKIYIFIFCSVLLFVELAYGRPSKIIGFERDELTSIEKGFFNSIHRNRNKLQTYYDGFLIASGITENKEFEYYKKTLDSLRKYTLKYMTQHKHKNEYEQGQQLLSLLYSSGILKSYSKHSTLANNLLDDGDYNCLTSTIIYTLLALELGLDVYAIFTNDHAFVKLNTQKSGLVNIETTSENGFGFVANHTQKQSIGIDFLIASLYANAISLVPNKNKNDITAYKKGFYISPTSDFFRNNLVVLLNNKAIDEVEYKNYDAASELLSTALKFDSENSVTYQNIVYYYYKQGLDYLSENDFGLAISTFEDALEATNNNSSILSNLKTAYYNYVMHEYKSDRLRKAKKILSRAMKRFPNDSDFIKLKETIS